MSNALSFPLSVASPTLVSDAQQLMDTYGFYLDEQVLPRLNLTPDRLELLVDGFSPLWVDFQDPQWLKRSRAGKQQGLVKACQPQSNLRVIDATAGWGRDAIILAHLGADVLMLERNPVMGALLQDGLCRFQPPSLFGSLSLLHTQAFDYLQTLTHDYPDVIYLDPMHPARQKSALVKKDMQILQHLIGPDMDVLPLIELARQRAHHRVVVKWPEHQPPLLKPNSSIHGKTIRFDIYLSSVD